MYVEEFRAYCLLKKGVTAFFPFDAHTLVFKVMGKMFALCSLIRLPSQMNLKCNPEHAQKLRARYDGLIIPGYHMSKVHWNTVMIQDNVPQALLIELIDHSYDVVVKALTKKLQAELAEL